MSTRPAVSLGELAVRFGCTLRGNPDLRVSQVGPLEHAGPEAVSFLANPRYRRFLAGTRAGVVVLAPELADDCPVNALLAKNPYAVYARIASLLYPPPPLEPGCHPSAVIHRQASIEPTAMIGPLAVIAAGVRIGPRVVIGAGSVVMEDVEIGADTRLVARVTLCNQVRIGERCLLHPGAVIGAEGFGLAPERGQWLKVPQIGSVVLGDDVEVGANTTIDRGAIGDTVIGNGVKLDNQIQIGHNVTIGEHTAIAGCTGVSGSANIGSRCMIGGMVGVAGHLSICDDVVITGKSFVSSSIRRPGYYSSGLPVDEAGRFRKNAARFARLDDFVRGQRQLRRAGEPAGDEAD